MTGNTPRNKFAGRVVSPGKWGLQRGTAKCYAMRNDLEQALNV